MLIHGKVSNNNVVPLLLDASGNVLVSAAELTTTGGKLHVDANGNLIVSANQLTTTGGKILIDASGNVSVTPTIAPETTYDSILSSIINTSLPAGTSNQLDTAVPASQAYIWQSCTLQYTGTITNVHIRVIVSRSSTLYIIQNQEVLATAQYYSFNFDIPLLAGDQAGVRIIGATLNDDLQVYFSYRRIR